MNSTYIIISISKDEIQSTGEIKILQRIYVSSNRKYTTYQVLAYYCDKCYFDGGN